MKSPEQIEQSIQRLNVEPDTETREQTLRDLVEAHTRQKVPTIGSYHLRRTIMACGARKIAALLALALVLVAMLGLATGSVAFSQASHAVNATLAWLRQVVVGPTPGEPTVAPPTMSAGTGAADPNAPQICYTLRFFRVPETEKGVWQLLASQKVGLVSMSTDPEVSYATLTRLQTESLNGYYATLSRLLQAQSLDASLALRCLSSPRVAVSAGEIATMALTDSDPQKGRQGFALALLPTVAPAGEEIRSTISFHDGHHGFELPRIATEPGGAVLIRTRIMLPDRNEVEGQGGSSPKEFLIQIQADMK